MNSRQNVKIKHYYKFPTVPKTDDSQNSMTDVQCNHANYFVCILGNATSSLPDIEPPGHFAPSIFLGLRLRVGLGVGLGSWVRVRLRFKVMDCVRVRDRARGWVKVRGCSMSRRLDVAHLHIIQI